MNCCAGSTALGLDTHGGRPHALGPPPCESSGADPGKRLLQRLFQSWGQWQHRNALFQQLQRLIKVCLPANGALIRFTQMHFAGFFGEAFAHILRLGNGLPYPLQPRRSLGSV